MQCTQCGSVVETDARFCGDCGTKITPSENIPVETANEQAATTIQPAVQTSAAAGAAYDYAEQGKKIGKQFWSFALAALNGPMKASKTVTEADKINGIIAHVLFALLLPLFSYFSLKSVSYGVVNISFDSVVMQPFFFLLIYLAVYTAVVFFVAKLMKVNISYTGVLAKYGVFNVLPAAVLVGAILFSWISATVFSFILFGISLGLFLISSLSVVFSIRDEQAKGMDVYYGLIIANVVMFIIFLVIGDSVVGSLMDQLEEAFWGF